MEQQQFEFEVRDMRHKEKFSIDDLYLNGFAKRCGIYATGVYVSLCRHAENKTQLCYPSYKKIAEELNISRSQVIRAIKQLEKLNIVKKIRIGKKLNNRYYLLDKSEWISEVSDRNFTGVRQELQPVSDRNFHSKGTQLRYTQKKEFLSFKKPKRYFQGKEMRFSQNKWWVLPEDGGEWLEFAGDLLKDTKEKK